MPRGKPSKGKCAYCGHEMAENGVARQLVACAQWKAVVTKAKHKKRRGLEEAQSKSAGRRTGTGYEVWRVRGERARDCEALHPQMGRAL